MSVGGVRTFSFLQHTGIPHRLRYKFGVVVIFVSVETGDIEIDGAIGLVGESPLDDLLDEGHVLGDVLRDSGEAVGTENLRS